MQSGPLADSAVTPSISFSSTTTERPTKPNSYEAASKCDTFANLPLHRAVIPQLTTQGVLGIARITGTFVARDCSITLVGTDAATEISNCPGERCGPISFTTSTTTCGFTQTRIMSAPRTAATLSVCTEMLSFSE